MSSATSLTVDSTYSWADPATAYDWNLEIINRYASGGGLNKDSIAFIINNQQYWCTRASSLTVTDPNELTDGINYVSMATAMNTHFAFTFSDSSCDRPNFDVAMTCDYNLGTWTTIPQLVQDAD